MTRALRYGTPLPSRGRCLMCLAKGRDVNRDGVCRVACPYFRKTANARAKGRPGIDVADLQSFGPRPVAVTWRGTITKRLKKIKPTMPTINLPKGDEDGGD